MRFFLRRTCFLLSLLITVFTCIAQYPHELNSGWKCIPLDSIAASGKRISLPEFPQAGWMPATVPGTVLGTLLDNARLPDPFYGMNNEQIPDIFNTGRHYYTYWFSCDFREPVPKKGDHIWIQMRGVNYAYDVFLNGQQINQQTHKGMFLRAWFDITGFLRADGKNRLSILVYPVDPVGNANGGQGGDGTIARNVSHQYVAGWDWIQPIRDRNTGIWDKVIIERTGPVRLLNPQVVPEVPGVRKTKGNQSPAFLHISTGLQNLSGAPINGTLSFEAGGQIVRLPVTIQAHETKQVSLPPLLLKNPKLWWPNTYGEPYLYKGRIAFEAGKNEVSDRADLNIGVREIQYSWNSVTHSREILVNGQPVFIKGGNWIVSDELLRLSLARYDAEIRFHRDMNLNLIRVWGGALLERPEFYDACDRYGMLVMQDLWGSGDCNGRWMDPMKLDDQWTRRQYPDDHKLYLESVADQVCMIRNHPSLAVWCGGNEITPPEDIYHSLKDSVMPLLDGQRWFVDYSNSDSMSLNTLGGNGDGPYGIQPLSEFWDHRSFPFNSEVGSVGVGDYASLERFIPEENRKIPDETAHPGDSVWNYHKYIGYGQSLNPYGKPTDLKDFAFKAQIVNYDQYRGLIEGFSAHAWEWYTGVIIWKTQNPWTALRGQMYDYYLDPNACLYGLRKGGEPLHVMYNPVDGMISIINNEFEGRRSMMLIIKTYETNGKENLITQVFTGVEAKTVKKILPIKDELDKIRKQKGAFVYLQLLDDRKQPLCDNLYWVPDENENYSGLIEMKPPPLHTSAIRLNAEQIEISISNDQNNPIAFFNRVSLVNPETGKRILPAFFSDNYFSVLPGTTKKIITWIPPTYRGPVPDIYLDGWNRKKILTIALDAGTK